MCWSILLPLFLNFRILHVHRRNVKFSGVVGELRTYFTTNGHLVEGDTNGDAIADFSIEVLDVDHTIVWDTSDFIGLV